MDSVRSEIGGKMSMAQVDTYSTVLGTRGPTRDGSNSQVRLGAAALSIGKVKKDCICVANQSSKDAAFLIVFLLSFTKTHKFHVCLPNAFTEEQKQTARKRGACVFLRGEC